MKNELQKHPAEYTILTGFGLIALIAFILIKNPTMRFAILVFAIGYYLMWALVHHIHTKTLTLRVVLEYVLIALIALVALQITLTPYI